MLPSSPLLHKSERAASGVLEDNPEEDITPRKRRNSEDGSSNSPHVSTIHSFKDATVSEARISEERLPEAIPGDLRKDRRVENAWWRSWWIERKRIESGLHVEHPMFTEMYSHDSPAVDTEIDVELEGVPVTNHKIWEKYYSKFLSKISEEISIDPNARATSSVDQAQASLLIPQQQLTEPEIPVLDIPHSVRNMPTPSDPIPIPKSSFPFHEAAHTDKKVRGQGFFAGVFGKHDGSNAPGSALAALCAQPEAASLAQMLSQPATPPTASSVPIPAEFEEMDVVMLRKYFTEFHNSGRYGGDSVSPYLGEDPSVHSSNAFAFANFAGTFNRTSSTFPVLQETQPLYMPQVAPSIDTSPILIPLPVQDMSTPCSTGPAAADAMKLWIFTSLLSKAPDVLVDALWNLPTVDVESCSPSTLAANVCVRLGWIHFKTDSSHAWGARWLVLYDNFLLEFCTAELKGRPIGYCPLSGGAFVEDSGELASVRTESKAHFESRDYPVLVLRCMKECHARSPVMRVMMRLEPDSRGTNIRKLLKRACRLGVEDLYDLHTPTRAPGKENQEQESILGRGRFTEVHKASKKYAAGCAEDRMTDKCDGASVALKLVNKQSFWKRVQQGKERADTLIREVLTQAVVSVSHRDTDIPIVRLRGIFETLEYFVLELELMQSTDLFDRLSTVGVMTEEQAKSVSRQLVQAVQICSGYNIAHRDIKLSNVVFPLPSIKETGVTNAYIPIKLADFGMAGFVGEDGLLRGRCGTPGYVAPEILRASQQEGYAPNVDMFSVGVVTYTLLCGYEPFYGTTDRQLIQANKMAQYEFHMPEWSRISEMAKDFVRKLMADGNERMTHAEALRHPWLASSSEPATQNPSPDACCAS